MGRTGVLCFLRCYGSDQVQEGDPWNWASLSGSVGTQGVCEPRPPETAPHTTAMCHQQAHGGN